MSATTTRSDLSGKLIVASPYLSDGNFLRTVVFIIRHSQQGAFGLVVNRPTDRRFADLVRLSSADADHREDDFIHWGGPVDGPLLALHDLAGVGDPCGASQPPDKDEFKQGATCVVHDNPADPFGSMSIDWGNPPAWITVDEDHLRILHRRRDIRVRYVSSYSGWSPGQLDAEWEMGGWLVCDADPSLLFGDVDDTWNLAVRKCGHDILSTVVPGIVPGRSIDN